MLSTLFSNCNLPIMNPATIHPNVPKNLITGNDFPVSDTFAKTILFDKATVGM